MFAMKPGILDAGHARSKRAFSWRLSQNIQGSSTHHQTLKHQYFVAQFPPDYNSQVRDQFRLTLDMGKCFVQERGILVCRLTSSRRGRLGQLALVKNSVLPIHTTERQRCSVSTLDIRIQLFRVHPVCSQSYCVDCHLCRDVRLPQLLSNERARGQIHQLSQYCHTRWVGAFHAVQISVLVHQTLQADDFAKDMGGQLLEATRHRHPQTWNTQYHYDRQYQLCAGLLATIHTATPRLALLVWSCRQSYVP